MEKSPFSQRLRELSARNGLSQVELARRTDLSRPTINRICRGKAPTLEQLRSLAAAFDQPVEQLVEGTDAENVLAEAAIGPSLEDYTRALQEAATAKAEVIRITEERDLERSQRRKLETELGQLRETVTGLETARDEDGVRRRQLEDRLRASQDDRERLRERLETLQIERQALAKKCDVLTQNHAMLAAAYRRGAASYEQLRRSYLNLVDHSQQLGQQLRQAPEPLSVLASGLLGFAVAGLLAEETRSPRRRRTFAAS